ncbi:NADH-quinone oxidoreductase subunit NuoH [Hymenobacter negativus]|uniref:NADH-quinone oxidoreductase subunit H n=1 Tax=Hymenobacter negativus TaxID=2795026 RepID=A0ABS0QBN5_9BACT|nr:MULTISPECIES: NADH-quinone oxidoreductase subunit NuoH [Bacteria]MBH8560091.1 NADH-quinone oxidoreductase subunit NuoH [Hymenobacter negativus]MBH8568214.1 NADH-quinone oxidoreductase subunit NuoH [Hymenobacter negativus]MBR7207949.1 NADH-quinone oxidoreductase subunit NuoH [Microvirga sp. STS02]
MTLPALGWQGLVVLATFGISLLIATYCTYFERVWAAFFQDRVGPDRAGPFGLLQPLADAVKLFTKEEFFPAGANRALFIFGPCLAMVTALMSSAVIPFGNFLKFGDTIVHLQGIEINVGMLYVFGVVALGVYGIMIGGWASNNKFSLLGAIRAASQNISYELAMGLALIAVLMMSGTLSLREITLQQSVAGEWHFWNIVRQPLGFVIFLVCAFAETNRTPFDLPECETELIGGYHTEYSSMKMGLYLFAEYVNVFVATAVMSVLYFGGFNYPFQYEFLDFLTTKTGLSADWAHNIFVLMGVVAMFTKIFIGIFFFMWVRWTLPRFRYDQLMRLGWTILIPLAIFNILLTGGLITFGVIK